MKIDGGIGRMLAVFPYSYKDFPTPPEGYVRSEWALIGPDPDDATYNLYRIEYQVPEAGGPVLPIGFAPLT